MADIIYPITPQAHGNKSISETIIARSGITSVADTIILSGLPLHRAHYFASVRFFSDANGTPTTPSGGTVVIVAKTHNNPDFYESITNGTIAATAPVTVSWAANTLDVKASPSGLTGATHMQLVVTSNES